MTAQQFRNTLRNLLLEAQQQGKRVVDINSGQLHRIAGGYPGISHRMPSCCEVMRNAMTMRDTITRQPPKGNGASLTIRYFLPRYD